MACAVWVCGDASGGWRGAEHEWNATPSRGIFRMQGLIGVPQGTATRLRAD
jgi:hypothetical protein